MITSIVILAVTSNVVLSLGMVGALSIVRFRTAIKRPTGYRIFVLVYWRRHYPCGWHDSFGNHWQYSIGLIFVGVCQSKVHTHPYMVVLNCRNVMWK